MRRYITRAHVAIFVIALAAYTPAFWWGVPHVTADDREQGWALDDELPLGPLGQMYDLVANWHLARPRPDANQNLGYPLLHSFIFSAAASPYIAWLWATGEIVHPTGSYPFGFRDPATQLRNLALLAHFLSVLFGAAIVVLAYEIGRTLWDDRTGRWSAALAGLAFPMFFYARTGNVDVPALFFKAGAFVFFARCVMHGVTVRRGLWLGAFVGLALATKEPSFASFVGVAVALAFLRDPTDGVRGWKRREFWRTAAVAFGLTLLVYAIGSGLAEDPARWAAHIAWDRQRVSELASDNLAYLPSYPRTPAGNLALLRLMWNDLANVMTMPGLLAALAGVVIVARARSRQILFVLPALTRLIILFFSARVSELHYVMPATFTLAFFAARALAVGLNARRAVRVPVAAFAALIVLLASLRAADLTYAMLFDSRYAAGEWFARVARAGDRIEYFGSSLTLPPLAQSVVSERALPYLGGSKKPRIDSAAADEVRSGWESRRPRFVIMMPDGFATRGQPFAASCPPRVYSDLLDGKLGYRMAAQFETPPLMPWIHRPPLDYPLVNLPIRIFVRNADSARTE